MLRIVFWILFALEIAVPLFAAVAGVIGVLTGQTLNSMMLLIVPAGAVTLLLALIGVWFYFTNSKFALAVLCLPFLLVPFLLVMNLLGDSSEQADRIGNLDFKQPGKRRLANAIAANDLTAVKASIADAGDLKIPGERSLPILLFALRSAPGKKPNPAIIAALLEAGADPNGACPYTEPVLDQEEGLDSIKQVIKNVGRPISSCAAGTLPLDETTDFEIVELLVKHGADPNKKGRYAPVWFNAFGDYYTSVPNGDKIFDLYRANGLRLEGVNSRGQGPIAAAAFGRDWHSLRVILESGADPNGVMIVSKTLSEHLREAARMASSYGRVPEDLDASIRIVNSR
ncbi:MAG: hypothetical protein FJW32_21635 [Acidobacteria bacterium]|nr:hypothetical protein [Acidobacteriota bacterium]